MLTMIPQFTIGATELMAIFLLMSSVGMLVVILGAWVYVFSINAGGTSFTLDAGLGVCRFVVSKLWMTSMLPMVALYNAIGGGAAGAFAAEELLGNKAAGAAGLIVTLIGALIGAASLSGSVIAWAKLHGVIDRPLRARSRQCFSLAAVAMTLAVGGCIAFTTQSGADPLIGAPGLLYLVFGCALLLGALLTLPIGRLRMPVAISIYNGCTGFAVGLEGFVLRSPTLMIAGVTVGTARMLLMLLVTKR